MPGADTSGRHGPRRLDPDAAAEHLDRLYRAAFALCGSRERAEDLVQETYARVLARPRFLLGDDDIGYLLRALRNTFISQQRSARSRPAIESGDELERIVDPTAHDPQAVAEARLVYEAIAALSPDFRDAIVAVDVVGLRYREAARALGVREATVTTRLFRARRRVAEVLRAESSAAGRFSTPAASLCS
jgi:RNA polymerase sigma-70 factor (ECF subfamily)